jgi:integrating conjugative element protein (TIGR03765 family)
MTKIHFLIITTTILLIILLTNSVNSEIIFDSGETEPINKYIDHRPIKLQQSKKQPKIQQSTKLFEHTKTPELTVGYVSTNINNQVRAQLKAAGIAIFIVGSDPTSLKWLSINKKHLTKLKALGIAVNISDHSQFRKLQAITPTLTITPTNGKDYYSTFNIKHYPVLISSNGLEQ